ncbi:MAG: bifunctional UDP-N-acetylglucosamine diphosphorylase/glucosamine-1-phosphate N-acetyltransferase GlmU [Bacillota bacterium]
MSKITAVILAAGAGTRMKSKMPKVLHKVCGKPMVQHVIDIAKGIKTEKTILVVGHGAEQVQTVLEKEDVSFVLQKEQLGTGHAVMQAEAQLDEEGYVLLLYGDTPLIRESTIQKMIEFHGAGGYQATVLTSIFHDPTAYGRIIKNASGEVIRIVEEKDATMEEKKIQEINSGIYLYDAKLLKASLKKLTNQNAQKEYYITDVVQILNEEGHRVGAFVTEDPTEIMGVNSRIQLAEAEKEMRRIINAQLMESGVTIIDPDSVYIEKGVSIGRDTVVYPGVILTAGTEIGEDCIIGHNTRIENSMIKDRVEIQHSTIIDSFVDEDTHVGPYAYLRPKSTLGKHVKVGDFVEVKNAVLGDYSKASHLAYIGDAEVGKHVNIGCGVVFVNYDGKNKHKTVVEDNAFVGSNVNLVAPVTVKKYGYIATGSTITKEVPEGALSVARAKQANIDGWVERKGLIKKEK